MTQSINKKVSEAKTKKEKTMNNKLFTKNAVRHGEILITPIDDLPENLEQIFEGKEYVVGHSETGHHHLAVAGIGGTITMFRPVGADDGTLFMRVNKDSRIEHKKSFDKHETKTLFKGIYQITIKKEWNYFKKIQERVQD